jgi:AcrR family transcriptional regulator
LYLIKRLINIATMNQNKQALERPRGRPIDDDQQDLKSQILDTAEEFFAEKGYAATSIRRIADRAGVNPALVHYYFGNKHKLLQTVIERTLEPLGKAIASLKDAPESSPETIARLLLSMTAEHPNIPRLLVREVLLPGGEMQEFFAENMAPRLGGALPALLQGEKSAGRLRHNADPAISALLILAVCVFPSIARTLAEPVLGISYDKTGIEELNEQVLELLKRGMTS